MKSSSGLTLLSERYGRYAFDPFLRTIALYESMGCDLGSATPGDCSGVAPLCCALTRYGFGIFRRPTLRAVSGNGHRQ